MRISDWSSDVCSSDLAPQVPLPRSARAREVRPTCPTVPYPIATSADPATTLKSTVPVRSDDTGEVMAMGDPSITPVAKSSSKVVVPSDIVTSLVAGPAGTRSPASHLPTPFTPTATPTHSLAPGRPTGYPPTTKD